ncbi:MAG: alpha/beta hydrolase-fold protein, partial [Saprospiraceae bacterium]
MKRFISSPLFLLLLFACSAQAQLTIKVTAIPANTPPGSSIYIAGNFNNWDPGDATKILTALGGGQFSIVLNPPNGTVEFKLTRGSWATVEGDANGNQQANHVTTYNGQPKTVEVPILTWEDQGSGSTGTAAPNVQIMDTDFYIPQLNRSRRIWLYLPPDYASTTKKYPVLYMQDAQNLFDASTSFSGEWEVDESLNDLHAQGDYGCIVVGIDNGGSHRLDEYSPWVNPDYGGGEGDEYLEFMVNTLKPYIDANYRTLP